MPEGPRAPSCSAEFGEDLVPCFLGRLLLLPLPLLSFLRLSLLPSSFLLPGLVLGPDQGLVYLVTDPFRDGPDLNSYTLERRMPLLIRALQVDRGSGFAAAFEAACQERGLHLFVLPPPLPEAQRAGRAGPADPHGGVL